MVLVFVGELDTSWPECINGGIIVGIWGLRVDPNIELEGEF